MKIFESKGSKILYDTWGDPSHRPLLFFHGFPGSHLQASALEPFLIKHKFFLVATDRPGYGGSTSSGSKFDYLDLLRELLNQMNIQKFDVLGVSGGSPWAHLMASRFALSVTRTNLQFWMLNDVGVRMVNSINFLKSASDILKLASYDLIARRDWIASLTFIF